MQKWRCESCKYEYEGEFLEYCPSCKKSCGFVDATNYVPVSFTGREGRYKKMENRQVNVYCDPFCPSCKDIADFLKENNIEFDFINVEDNEAAMKEVVSLSGQDKLPVIKIGDKIIAPPIDRDKLLDAVKN